MLLCAAEVRAQGGVIKGEIKFPDAGLDAATLSPQTVVQVRPEKSAAGEVKPGSGVRIELRHGAFSPTVVAVALGAKVEIANADQQIHNVLSTSAAKKFDLGMIEPGKTASVTFDKPGVVRLICKAEPAMEGFVVIVAGGRFAVAGDRGQYEIGGLAPGSYVAEAWNPRYEPQSTHLSITRDGEVVAAEFQFTKKRSAPWP
jgi:plastocyanin